MCKKLSEMKKLLPFANPLLLALTALSYLLGTSIARYLGRADSPLNFWLGFVWITLLILATNFLTVYFRPHNEPLIENETIKERNWLRAALFQISLVLLGGVELITVVLFQKGVSPIALIFAGIVFLITIAYALPPIRLVTNGFGEFALATLLSFFIPAFSLTLQMGESHRLLETLAYPLLALTLAFFLVLEFPTYKEDLKYERGTLLFRVGWERAILLHHILVFSAYFFFSAMPLFNLPRALFLPIFYTAPFALFQIFWMQKIAHGAPPNWKFLKILSHSVIGLTFYILIVTLWMR